ncbi:MAG: hemagluttinin repeat-containing protein [Bacteroidota bacterium]|jgi:hypothetical protein|nr:hemagluttinin repeat-containing protein [Bacteroidota bacterium]
MKHFNLIKLSFFALFTCLAVQVSAISYTSAGTGPSSWLSSTTWIPNGVPTSSDDVTISAGHTVFVNATGCAARNLTVAGTLQLISNTMSVRGNYNLSGTETGSGTILFIATNISLTITGTSSPTSRYSFSNNATVQAGSTLTKAAGGIITLAVNKTLTNLGICTFSDFIGKSGSVFVNSAGATLSLLKAGFMSGATFHAHATGNTVNLRYAAGAVPLASSGYYNLSLTASTSGTKTLAANTVIANNLTMNAGNHLNTNNFDLSVAGNWTNAATFTASAGKTVTFNGTAAQSVSNTFGTTTFKGLTINNTNGVTLTSGTYILDEVITVSNGTFNTGGRSFTMTSDATQTARIAPITGTGAIAGNFTVERFITSRDSTWADLSSPVQNSTFNDWDNELPVTYYTFSPPSSYPTQWIYDETEDAFSAITSSATALTPGQGFEVYMTGDFSYSNLPNTTINTIGVPNQTDQDLSGLISFNSAGSNLVGNPFASSIRWSDVFTASSGILNTYDVFDAASGNYATFGLGTEIGSTQGFWVYTTTSTATLIIPESSKSTSSNSSLRSVVAEPYLSLKFSANDAGNSFYHTLKVAGNNTASDGWDSNDHPFHKSPNPLAPSIYTKIDGRKAVINSFNSFDDNFSMPVSVSVAKQGFYKIEAAGLENVSEYSCITLEDKVLNKTIDLTKGEAYSFELNTNEASDRFILHLTKSGNCRAFVNSDMNSELNNQVSILPTVDGNTVTFDMEEATPATINVTNIMGQNIVETTTVLAENQTVNLNLPQDFSGMYIVKIESSKGLITKKYVRK